MQISNAQSYTDARTQSCIFSIDVKVLTYQCIYQKHSSKMLCGVFPEVMQSNATTSSDFGTDCQRRHCRTAERLTDAPGAML